MAEKWRNSYCGLQGLVGYLFYSMHCCLLSASIFCRLLDDSLPGDSGKAKDRSQDVSIVPLRQYCTANASSLNAQLYSSVRARSLASFLAAFLAACFCAAFAALSVTKLEAAKESAVQAGTRGCAAAAAAAAMLKSIPDHASCASSSAFSSAFRAGYLFYSIQLP